MGRLVLYSYFCCWRMQKKDFLSDWIFLANSFSKLRPHMYVTCATYLKYHRLCHPIFIKRWLLHIKKTSTKHVTWLPNCVVSKTRLAGLANIYSWPRMRPRSRFKVFLFISLSMIGHQDCGRVKALDPLAAAVIRIRRRIFSRRKSTENLRLTPFAAIFFAAENLWRSTTMRGVSTAQCVVNGVCFIHDNYSFAISKFQLMRWTQVLKYC